MAKTWTTTHDFKVRYPRLYKKIMRFYGEQTVVYNRLSAIMLYLNGKQLPRCELCDAVLTITSTIGDAPFRCKKHINTTYINLAEIANAAQQHNKLIAYAPKDIVRSTMITLLCNNHGEYQQSAGYILDGGNCQKCYHAQPRPQVNKEQWLHDSNVAHNYYYAYDKVEYNNLDSLVTITCPVHGDFQQVASVHRRGHGCSQCAVERNQKNLMYDTNTFTKMSNDIHNKKYSYGNTLYTGSRNLVTITCPIHGDFQQVAYYHLAGNGCPSCGIALTTNKSAAEYELLEYLESFGVECIHSDRSLGVELDIYIPARKVAIEYNGLYWHSSASLDTDKKCSEQHLQKTELCESNNIQLLHIFDNEWNDPVMHETWKSTILHKLNLTPIHINARECYIKPLTAKTASTFLDNNHLQKSCPAQVKLGLYDKQHELVAVMTLGKTRFSKTYEYELLRYVTKNFHNIRGGFSKLFKYFCELYDPDSVISYANRRWSFGNVYKTTGFLHSHVSGPCYYYTNNKQIWHRTKFQKHKLSSLLEHYNKEHTEVENMYNHGYRRIWDSGHIIYYWRK